MQVVLTENVKSLGKKLDVVNVSEGYARNYLFPRKLAKMADNKSLSEANTKKEAIKFKKDTEREEASKLKGEIENLVIEFRLKAASGGKLFGSVTSKEIAEELSKKKYSIDKKKITMDEAVKSAGMYTAKIKLYEGIVANLKVKVVGV